ncbi:MAG: oligosaccharide flippase family protein [Lachnospiraceae bacterium]|nr:oligosaccharide flippase family protein [Lachnospiraceae bacterium]
MQKLKLFVENFFVYGLGGIISRLIPLILVPVIIRLFPDPAYYGLTDLSATVIQFGSALALMGMSDAMYRMFFEREDEAYKRSVCSTALLFTLFTSLFVFLVMLLFKEPIAAFFFGDRAYAYLVCITAVATLVGATNNIVSAPTRMQNKKKVYLTANILSPVLAYSLAIPLIQRGYYVIALPLSMLAANLTIEVIFYAFNCRWFCIRKFDFKLLREMLAIAIPLMPNLLIYWVFNSSDRVMIANLAGTGASGVYAVGAKLGHVSQLIYTAFAGGWQFFAFSTMREKDQVASNSWIFEYLGILSFIAGAFMCALSGSIFRVLFTPDYREGYLVAPYLFLAPLLQMLFQVIGNQFLIIRKTWPVMVILLSGAALNVVLNLWFIPRIGIEGAAIATLTGYMVSNVIAVVVLRKMRLLDLSLRFCACAGVMLVYFVAWRFIFSQSVEIGIVAAWNMMLVCVWFYRQDLRQLICVLSRAGKHG